jgi:hypothetical protein
MRLPVPVHALHRMLSTPDSGLQLDMSGKHVTSCRHSTSTMKLLPLSML